MDIFHAPQASDNLGCWNRINWPLYCFECFRVGRLNAYFELKETWFHRVKKVEKLDRKTIRSNLEMKQRLATYFFYKLPDLQCPLRVIVKGAIDKSNRFWLMAQDVF